MIQNLPEQELLSLVKEYQQLPFRNGTQVSEEVGFTTACNAWIQISMFDEGDNPETIKIVEGIDLDEEGISEVVRNHEGYNKKADDVKFRLESFSRRLAFVCKQYNVSENEIWRHLYSLPPV